jgi:hypothetical protein
MTTVRALSAENTRLRTLFQRVAFHAVGKKPEDTSPSGNRLQAILSCCVMALGDDEVTAAIHAAEKRGDR